MTIIQLQYLMKVYELQSVVAAAKAMHISPSGLSKAVNKLEDELGFQILTHENGEIRLTTKGRRLMPEVSKLLSDYHQLQIKSNELKQSSLEVIKLSVTSSVKKLYQTVSEIQHQNQNIIIQTVESTGPQIIKKVANGDFDLGLVTVDSRHMSKLDGLDYKIVREVYPQLYVPKTNRLTHKQKLSKNDLLRQRYIRINGDPVSDMIYQRLQRNVGPLQVHFFGGNQMTVAYFAYLEKSVFITTDFQFSSAIVSLNQYFATFPLRHFVDEHFTLLWVFRDDYYQSPAVKRLLETPVE